MIPVPLLISVRVNDVPARIGVTIEYTALDGMAIMMVYTTTQLVARILRLKVQFRGSSGSSLGRGTSIISPCPSPSACLEMTLPPVSISRTVPGGRRSPGSVPCSSSLSDMAGQEKQPQLIVLNGRRSRIRRCRGPWNSEVVPGRVFCVQKCHPAWQVAWSRAYRWLAGKGSNYVGIYSYSKGCAGGSLTVRLDHPYLRGALGSYASCGSRIGVLAMPG